MPDYTSWKASGKNVHVARLGVSWLGRGEVVVAVAVALRAVRMFAINGFYRRCFSRPDGPDLTSGAVRFRFEAEVAA